MTTRMVNGNAVVDAEAAFRAVGRGDLVDRYAPPSTGAQGVAPTAGSPRPLTTAPAKAACRVIPARPRGTVRLLDGVVRVAVTCPRPDAALSIELLRIVDGEARRVTRRVVSAKTLRSARGVVRMVAPSRWTTAQLRFDRGKSTSAAFAALRSGKAVALR